MNILSIGSDRNLFDKNSAVARRIIGYAEQAERYTVIVFTLRSRDGEKQSINLSARVQVFPTNSRSKLRYIPDAVRIGMRIIKEGDTWTVTCQDPFEAGFAGWCIARHTHARLHLQVHTDFMSPYFKKESLLNRLRVRIARFLLPRADEIRVVSERIKRSIEKLTEAPVTVLPIFVAVSAIADAVPLFGLRKKYPQFEHIILMANRLTKEKDIPTALAAFKKVLMHFPKALLLIVGDGPEKKNIESRITNYDLQNNVVLTGWQNDLVPYYKGADIFLNTSLYEGYGMSLVEAAAAGRPIVTTDVGVAGELTGVPVVVCPVRDADCIALKLKEVLRR